MRAEDTIFKQSSIIKILKRTKGYSQGLLLFGLQVFIKIEDMVRTFLITSIFQLLSSEIIFL